MNCNIWVSFLIGHYLTEVREMLTSPTVEVYSCPQLMAEVVDVTGRDKIRRYVTDTDVEDSVPIAATSSSFTRLRLPSATPKTSTCFRWRKL